MKITEAKINWYHGWANYPRLEIKAENVPSLEHTDPIWTMQDNGVVYACEDGVVNYLAMGNGMVSDNFSRSSMRGFGGRLFEITLKDGTVVRSNNAWSSRAECVFYLQCVETVINNCNSALTLELYEYLVCNVLEQFIVWHNGDRVISSTCLAVARPSRDLVVGHKVNLDIEVKYVKKLSIQNS